MIKATRYTVIKYIVCSVWLLSESFHVSVKHFNLSVIMPLDRLYEEYDVVAVSLLQVAELLDGVAGVALGVAVPHDGLQGVACAAVVETVFGTGTELRQSATPERSGAAPASADIVLHVETVLHEVGVWPYLLVRIAWHVVVCEDAVRVLYVVIAGGP